MEWGPHLKALTSQLKPGETLPFMDRRPRLKDELIPFWDAFFVLSNSRSHTGFGPNPVSFADLKAYLELFEVREEDDIDDFIFFIQLLDGIYLSRKAAEASKELNKGQGHVGQRSSRIHNR